MIVKESMTTREYFKSIPKKARSGFSVEDRVAFDAEEFVRLAETSNYRIVNSHDGPVSVVQETAVCEAVQGMADFSKQSGNFDLHQDGLYYPEPPHLALLWCEDDGAGRTITSFYDGEALAEALLERFDVGALMMNYVGRDGQPNAHRLICENPNTGRPVLMMASRGFISIDSTGRSSLRDISKLTTFLFDHLADYCVFNDILRTGEAILYDNWRYPHSRRADSAGPDPRRTLLRIWLNEEP